MSSHPGSFCWSLLNSGKTVSLSEDTKYRTDMAIFEEEEADSCCLKPFMGSWLRSWWGAGTGLWPIWGVNCGGRLIILDMAVEGDRGGNKRRKREQHVTRAFGRWELVAQRSLCFTKTVGKPLSSNVKQVVNSKPHCVKRRTETQDKALTNTHD